MPKRDSRRAVTRVSSHKMRSALRNTHNARNVTSPRFPIGVATRCRPGASSCSGAHSAAAVAETPNESRANDPNDWLGPGLLDRVRWLGSRALAPLPESTRAALAFFAVRLTDRCSDTAVRAGRLHARANGSGARWTTATARHRPRWTTARRPAARLGRTGQGPGVAAAIRRQCRVG